MLLIAKLLLLCHLQYESFDPIVSSMHMKAEDLNLIDIAMTSNGGHLFDIKKDYANVGILLNGKYATSRSAGNF